MTRHSLGAPALSLILLAGKLQAQPSPCQVLQSLSCPATVNASTSGSCTNPEFLNFAQIQNWYSFNGVAGQAVTVEVASTAVEVQLTLWQQGAWSSTATFGVGCTAEPCLRRTLTRTFPSSGVWIIAVDTYFNLGGRILDAPGPFTLTVTGSCSAVPTPTPTRIPRMQIVLSQRRATRTPTPTR